MLPTLALALAATAHAGVVVNTWPFTSATAAGYDVLASGGSALDAVEAGSRECEYERCDGSVGFGGSPGENGETTLDALVMDGTTHDAGAVAGLERIKNAVGVARAVMEHTDHTMLVGAAATDFAKQLGFPEEPLFTADSLAIYEAWLARDCQPNYWKNVSPDPSASCGPYKPLPLNATSTRGSQAHRAVGRGDHDTIGVLAVDDNGDVAVGTSTNGRTHKIRGRVGDTPVIGAGGYADTLIGAAACTGDGDTMMRFLPAYVAVQNMRLGMNPTEAGEDALARIAQFVPDYAGAIVVMSADGEVGGACHKFGYSYSYQRDGMSAPTVVPVECIA